MVRRPPRSTLLTHSFPTRLSSDLGRLALLRACAVGAGSGSGDTLIDGRDGQQPGSTRRVRRKEPMAKVEEGDTPTGASAAEEIQRKLCDEPAGPECLCQAAALGRTCPRGPPATRVQIVDYQHRRATGAGR